MVPRSLAPPLVAVLVSACLAEATGLFGHRLDLSPDSVTFDALGDTLWVAAVQYGHAGSRLPSPAVTYASSDPSVVAVDSFGLLTSRQNGAAHVTARAASGEADSILVTVSQQVDRVEAPRDRLLFNALETVQLISAAAVDRLGSPVAGAALHYSVADSVVATVSADGEVRARANGVTRVTATVPGESVTVSVRVEQIPDTIVFFLPDTMPVLSLGLDSLIPLLCQALDRNSYPLEVAPTVSPSTDGRWSGSTCQTLRVRRSGFDTLRVSYNGVTASQPLVLAVRPIVSNVRALPLDSMPSRSGPWSPTARRNSQGQLEVYATGYVLDSVSGRFRGHLHRYLSTDGVSFAYDGIAVQRDDSLCALNGSGIENITIVPRADGPGWRMFYAGGSFVCYGWQVFSAVSSDERTWIKEPGVRISNGLPLSQPRGAVPWPAGEGMVVDRAGTGEWRMIVSTYEPLEPPENKFQITEWRSSDQLNWTYIRTVFSTRQLPPEGQRSAYSPTISEVVPGLWRMILTADNLNTPGGRSRLWSAVSTDEINWMLEGALLDSEGHDFSYSTIVDDQLVFLHAQTGVGHRLAIATVSMP